MKENYHVIDCNGKGAAWTEVLPPIPAGSMLLR